MVPTGLFLWKISKEIPLCVALFQEFLDNFKPKIRSVPQAKKQQQTTRPFYLNRPPRSLIGPSSANGKHFQFRFVFPQQTDNN